VRVAAPGHGRHPVVDQRQRAPGVSRSHR
jgi:hypothetical protein